MADNNLTPLESFGAKLDADQAREALTASELEQHLYEHRLLLIDGLPQSDELLSDIAHALGTPQVAHPASARVTGLPFIKHQVAGRSHNYDAAYWHSDRNFGTTPAKATVLQCVVAPEEGGETPVCDGVATLAALDQYTRQVLRTWQGIYEFGDIATNEREHQYSDPNELKTLEDFTEPLVSSHPVTGKESLSLAERYANLGAGDNLIDPGRPKLDTLLEIIERGVIYRHRWSVGDILIWDNHATLHRGELLGDRVSKITHRIVVR